MGGTCRGKVARGSARRFCKQSRGREGDAIRAFGSRGAAGRGEQAGPRIPSLVAPGQSAPPRGASVSPHSGQGVEGPPCASYSLDRGCRKPRLLSSRAPATRARAGRARGVAPWPPPPEAHSPPFPPRTSARTCAMRCPRRAHPRHAHGLARADPRSQLAQSSLSFPSRCCDTAIPGPVRIAMCLLLGLRQLRGPHIRQTPRGPPLSSPAKTP